MFSERTSKMARGRTARRRRKEIDDKQKACVGERLAAQLLLRGRITVKGHCDAGEQLAAHITSKCSREVAHIDRRDFQPGAELDVSLIPSWIFLEIASDIAADDKVSRGLRVGVVLVVGLAAVQRR